MQELQTQVSQYNHLPQHRRHMPGLPPFPYYPAGMCYQRGQMSGNSSLQHTFGSQSSAETKNNKVDRREAALIKFRQKRKDRCFDKKIRYVNRKKLAERRPRVRGQFVRKLNGVNVDLNGLPSATDCEDEEEDDTFTWTQEQFDALIEGDLDNKGKVPELQRSSGTTCGDGGN